MVRVRVRARVRVSGQWEGVRASEGKSTSKYRECGKASTQVDGGGVGAIDRGSVLGVAQVSKVT